MSTAILEESLKKLHLSTMRACYMEEADMARQESLTYENYLRELVVRECEQRQQKRIARYLRESKLPQEKSMAAFDRALLPAKVNSIVNTLQEGSFIDRRENVLAFGNPGSGKTHLFYALPSNPQGLTHCGH